MSAITTKCDSLEAMVAEFNACAERYPPSQYEAHEEALNLMKLAARHVAGIIATARSDLGLLPPAEVAARGAYEASVKAAWLMAPADPFERECRYIGHLRGEAKHLKKQARELSLIGIDPKHSEEKCRIVESFADDVSKLLRQKGYSPPDGDPPIPDMLTAIGERHSYGLYAVLCQTAHGGHYSTWIFRGAGLGTYRTRGEFITPEKWELPLNMARFTFKKPGLFVLRQLGLDASGLGRAVGPN
ncbi:hypothetical protein H8B02_06535 [Bradyrhizobium sp. Pear77]|uniref:hypothetical protein n=1 Tax=Bradyrhizobium altum TaxID=1571202 RepID=UPI001E4C0142|nr:hypothetical protein [Bradyrhizobium altum]MCC8953136.1 hypothetical protein [Bradyrhizobium altum]